MHKLSGCSWAVYKQDDREHDGAIVVPMWSQVAVRDSRLSEGSKRCLLLEREEDMLCVKGGNCGGNHDSSCATVDQLRVEVEGLMGATCMCTCQKEKHIAIMKERLLGFLGRLPRNFLEEKPL